MNNLLKKGVLDEHDALVARSLVGDARDALNTRR
jgi:hypothetical protein